MDDQGYVVTLHVPTARLVMRLVNQVPKHGITLIGAAPQRAFPGASAQAAAFPSPASPDLPSAGSPPLAEPQGELPLAAAELPPIVPPRQSSGCKGSGRSYSYAHGIKNKGILARDLLKGLFSVHKVMHMDLIRDELERHYFKRTTASPQISLLVKHGLLERREGGIVCAAGPWA